MRLALLLLAFSFVAGSILKAEEPVFPPFPKDHPGDVYPEMKIYDAQKNPIRMPKGDWAGAQQRISSDPDWAHWVQLQRADVDDWIAKRQDKVEWICGWFHDFVSPKDASELIYTPDEPGQETLRSRSDPQVELTPKLHGAWVFFFREQNSGEMIRAAQLYRVTGDKKYADWAAGQLDFYADNYLKWPLRVPYSSGTASRIMWQALDEASLVCNFIRAARILGKDYVTPERKQHWIDNLFKPEADLLQQGQPSTPNIGCWQRSAAAQIALYSNDEDLWKAAVDGPGGVHDRIARGVTSDYLWCEQSLHYNDFVVQALEPLFVYAQMAGRGAEMQEDMETIENLMLTPTEMRFPTGQLPNPADGGKAETAPDPQLWTSAATLYPTPYGVYHLAHEKSWLALVDPPDPTTVPSEEPQLPPVISRSYESSRMAVIRSGPWQVYLHYGQLTASHAQAEALNFEAFYKNVDVTQDPGSVGYGSPMIGYYRGGVCHNVPLVDGVGQISWDPGKLDSFSDTSVSASQPNYQPGAAKANRTMTIDGDNLKDMVHIATSGGSHNLGFLLHFMGKVENLPSNFTPCPDPAKIEPGFGFKYWKNVTSATYQDKAEFDMQFDNALIHVTFELPGSFTIWHASAPDLLPRRRDVFYLETRGQEATLNTTLKGGG